MHPYLLRATRHSDLPAIMRIIAQAQQRLRLAGIDQWQDGYPDEEVFLRDMTNGHSFVLTRQDGIAATVMISFDGEPTYRSIVGEWLSDQPYAVIHRLAVSDQETGNALALRIIDHTCSLCNLSGIGSIRIDTHRDNQIMQHIAEKAGFRLCGTITLNSGAQRLAYEKILF